MDDIPVFRGPRPFGMSRRSLSYSPTGAQEDFNLKQDMEGGKAKDEPIPGKENRPPEMRLFEEPGLRSQRRRCRPCPVGGRRLFRSLGPIPGRWHGAEALRHPSPDGPYYRRGGLQNRPADRRGFVQCESRRAREDLNRFLESVQVNACGTGIETFLGIYLEQLLTLWDGSGEIVVSQDGKEISGLYNASLDDVELRTGDSPLELKIYSRERGGQRLWSRSADRRFTLSPRPGECWGNLFLKGLPFVSSVQQHGPELG